MNKTTTLQDLVEKFEKNYQDYEKNYKEESLRNDFLNPFFALLGWDITNTDGKSESEREVIVEETVKGKYPDYTFRWGKEKHERFFVEAKKPSIKLATNADPVFQARSYGWTAKTPLVVVTNFEEFAVYDCSKSPKKTDKPNNYLVKRFTYTEYLEKWDEIAGQFSREAVEEAFKQYAPDKKKADDPVDDAFLQEIETWRELLARNIALRNPDLNQRDLNYAVQVTIDRIIFLRICEDRGIETASLAELLKFDGLYGELIRRFRLADGRYNSGLFHFNQERDRPEDYDNLTPHLNLDDETLKTIIRQLYPPYSPYTFSVMPAEILGQVYEQFLGKVIRLTAGHRAKVEEKPEVKKAGGVYYTPAYIVDYIVQQTVGKLLAGKTPKEAAALRILDPACGSGSFLIGAYQYLLNWHLDWYASHTPEKHKQAVHLVANDQWRLTIAERRRILTNTIYGVDIDAQAVEVTKLSLLLKVLEGESEQTVNTQLRLVQERALPDLGKNIQCGNTLIGSEFNDAMQMNLFDLEEQSRINIFNWERGFPEIMKAGGFDAIIGNPPYIRIQTLKEFAPKEVEFYKKHYAAASKGNYDIYVIFVERGLQLLNPNGLLGFILPHKFFNAKYGEPLRGLLAQGKHLKEIVHFGHQQVFKGATTYTCLLFLSKEPKSDFHFTSVDNLIDWSTLQTAISGSISSENITATDWNFSLGDSQNLQKKLNQLPTKLGNLAKRMSQGIRTSANEIFVLDFVSENGDLVTAYSKQLNKNVHLEREILLQFLQGREIKSYQTIPSGKVVIMPYKIQDKKTTLLSESEFSKQFPKTFQYLRENKVYLENREKGKFKTKEWYAYGRNQNIDLMLLPKILVPDIANCASFALDNNGNYAFTSGYGITLKANIKESPEYILGLLNSSVLDFYLKKISTTMRGGYFRYFTQFIEQLPIRTINFEDEADKQRHDEMVRLVERMLALHQQLAAVKNPRDKTLLQRQIDDTDRKIDGLVYELYGLTAEEIAIVEGR